MAKTITSANSKFTLTVPSLGLLAYTLEGYAADAAFLTEVVDVAETQKGVDGKMSAGFIPFITPTVVTLQADSRSKEFFDTWLGAMKGVKEIHFANAVIDIPSIGLSYICTKGALKRVSQIPGAAKVLQPVTYAIDWDDVQPVPLIAVGG